MRRCAAVLALAFVAASSAGPCAAGDGRETGYGVDDPDLDRLQDLFRPTLDANLKRFPASTQTVRGFGAGDVYPQVWLRDSATLLPLTRYLYPRDVLTSWLEEHLAHQADDGGLDDWIAAGDASRFREWAPRVREVFRSPSAVLSADKNTTEADQETSAVLSAGQVFRVTGDSAWLRKRVGRRSVIDACDAALRFVFARRFDERRGLATSALTADWGDVSPVYPDQRAIYLDERTPRVAGLYTNVLLYEAALVLADLRAAVGDAAGAASWRSRAAAVRRNIQRRLWQPGAGFYRMHVVLDPRLAAGFPDDAGLFAMGGNALAALHGVADAGQARRIFAAAESRRARYGITAPGSVLLPPYARGVFKHPLMAEPWQYQNGGQWDWFAGRLVLAEFQRGRSLLAYRHLVELARRAVRSGGLHEWWTRDGEPRGSPRYAGSAGALGQAVVEGLFGVSLAAGRLDVRIRLGERRGHIHLRQPATGDSVWYVYSYHAPRRTVTVVYGSSARPGTLAVLLPHRTRVRSASLDGRPVVPATERVGEDVFAALPTDWTRHRLEIVVEHASPSP
jgi:hypothetical protein